MAKKWIDKTQSVVEYLVALPFLLGAAQLPFTDPLGTQGFLVFFGGRIALLLYALWFAFIALGLIYAKVRKKPRAHKNFLLAIYLTTIYTSILTWYVAGFLAIIDDMVIGVLAAVCWLRWKFKTEYVDVAEYYEARHRDD